MDITASALTLITAVIGFIGSVYAVLINRTTSNILPPDNSLIISKLLRIPLDQNVQHKGDTIMSEPVKPADKAALLANIQAGYDQLEALLASLSEEQMTIPGVNGSWSIKDTLAHLTAWQSYQAARQEGTLDGAEPPDPAPGLETEDEINEYFYQQHKDRSLVEVLADFRVSYQRVLAATQALSWEALNEPFPWDDNNVPVGAYTIGNTYGHYEVHREMIDRWLELQA